MSRHTCIICGIKRYSKNMIPVLAKSWVCADKDCFLNPNIDLAETIKTLYSQLDKSVIKKNHIFGR